MRKKILLADDSATTLMLQELLLGGGPFDVITARNGSEALQKALAEHPAIILLDIEMPGMDGLEACARLRRHEETAATPIIVVSARGRTRDIMRAFLAGCDDYVTKPMDGLMLKAKVESLLSEAATA